MESENETRPLLHDFESETWRSKVRKRCLRIPSEVAITGIILGLFFVVVTLLIVLENMEDTKESDLSMDKTLLASPFKYNKKVEDKSWQDKKESIMARKEENNWKWDKANKGWKKFPDISERKDPNLLEASYADKTEIENLLKSPNMNWNEVDKEWKRLTQLGWKDKAVRDALVKAITERKQELEDSEGVLRSPLKLDQLWDNINDSWKKKIEEGNKQLEYQKMKGKKEKENQKNINDDWKNKMTLLQSPKADMKNIVQEDDGWKRLTEQGWKINDIKRAIVEAWKEKNLLQSPMNLQNLWGKASDLIKNIYQKGMDKQKSQKDINDEWANKFGGNLQSPKSPVKKGNFIDEHLKKWTKYDMNDKSEDEAEQNDESNQSINFEDIVKNIVEAITEYQKDHETKKFDKAGDGKENAEYSSMNIDDFLKNLEDTIKEHQKGNKEAGKQKNINDDWKNRMKVLNTTTNPAQKWKKIDDHWKTLIEYERNSYLEKNGGTQTSSTSRDTLQQSMPFDNVKREMFDDGWKRLTGQGWKDKDIKEAIYKAWKDGDKLQQSTMGYNNMKWKKVNDGWKKISNKS